MSDPKEIFSRRRVHIDAMETELQLLQKSGILQPDEYKIAEVNRSQLKAVLDAVHDRLYPPVVYGSLVMLGTKKDATE
jgi:hypothetical protein